MILKLYDFYISLTWWLFFDAASIFWDSTILGYLKALSPDVLIGYSSGTGISGLFYNDLIIGFGIFIK